MKTIYCNELIDIKGKSIFLAGPIPRNNNASSWKQEAIDILRELNFNGTVLIPESRNFVPKKEYMNDVNWSKEAIDKCDVLIFWVPREYPNMLGLTTNIEFGYYIDKKSICYGRPHDAYEINYLDWMYKDLCNDEPSSTLKETLRKAINK